MEKITVRELLTRDIDIDVVDDIDETIFIAFCGPMQLTAEGESEWGSMLDLQLEIVKGKYDFAILKLGDLPDWERVQYNAFCFFNALAGYCDCEDYDAWFKEV